MTRKLYCGNLLWQSSLTLLVSKAANSDYGLVVTAKATRYTLAHEIGHAFGMCDVYVSNLQQKDAADPLVELLPSEKASFSRLANDWNGGCDGSGSGGTRYYRHPVHQ